MGRPFRLLFTGFPFQYNAPPLANTPDSGSQQASQLSARAAPPAECRDCKSITEVKPSN